jgi:hypothetical protein
VTAKEFDVTIELTGNAKGLQAALVTQIKLMMYSLIY